MLVSAIRYKQDMKIIIKNRCKETESRGHKGCLILFLLNEASEVIFYISERK